MMKMYLKIENVMDLYYTFSTNEWKFENSNIRELWLSMSQEERNLFWFSLNEFDWKSYIKCYYYGIRKYILHEDPENIEKAMAKNRKYDIYQLIYFSSGIYEYYEYVKL